LGTTSQFIEVDYLQTPNHIIPEWYFLPYYAILKSIDDKFMGVLLFFLAIFQFMLVPFFSIQGVFEDNDEILYMNGGI